MINNQTINYSQCWEDTEVLLKALSINQRDTVLSITSGGDNTIALLLKKPKLIESIDLNNAQNYLLELKIKSPKVLTYEQYLELLCITNDKKNTIKLIEKALQLLSPKAKKYWRSNQTLLEKGIIHNGKFEKYLNLFRKLFLPFVHKKETINAFTSLSNMSEQKKFYKNVWNTKKWQLYFRIATSKSILKFIARQKGMFKYVEMKKVSNEYLKRLEQNLNNTLISNNFYLLYCLLGTYNKKLPHYLLEKNYMYLKNTALSSLSISRNDIYSHLKSKPNSYFTKYNLSDIFEALSTEQKTAIWSEIIRTAKNKAIVIYWDNLLQNSIPSLFLKNVIRNSNKEKELAKQDKVFFYSGFHIYTIKK